jgi:hypothetical protein
MVKLLKSSIKNTMKSKIELNLGELREIVMEAWVDGWYNGDDKDDSGKKDYWNKFCNKNVE